MEDWAGTFLLGPFTQRKQSAACSPHAFNLPCPLGQMVASELGQRRHGGRSIVKSEAEDRELRSVELLGRDSRVTAKQAAPGPH